MNNNFTYDTPDMNGPLLCLFECSLLFVSKQFLLLYLSFSSSSLFLQVANFNVSVMTEKISSRLKAKLHPLQDN